jgi:uncharacterized protein YkwD
MQINIIDILLVLIIGLNVLNGYRRGFILGILDLVGWALVLLAGLRFYQPVAKWIGPHINLWSDVWDRPFAFILIAVVVVVFIQAIGHALLKRVDERVHDRPANRWLGILPGLANGLITAALISALLLAMPLSERIQEQARNSPIVNRLVVYAERLETALHPVFSEAIAQTLNLLTVQPESNERVNLPFKVTNVRARPELEAAMLDMVNRERIAAGLKPLAPDPELREVARDHSTDMFARGYFAHQTPEGLDPFDRMRAADVSFQAAGENLALAPTLRVAHEGLMNSPGHRANILQKQFGRVGIGIIDGGMRGLMVTQNFRN